MDNVKIYWDTETTGLNFATDRIVEIGILVTQGDNIIEQYQQYINPEKPSDYEAYKVHKLSDEFLSKQPKFSEIYTDILDIFFKYNPYTVTAHNGDFDSIMLSQEFNRLKENYGINIGDYIKNTYPEFIPEKNRTYHFSSKENKYNHTGLSANDLELKDYSFVEYFPIEDTMLAAANFFNGKISLDSLAKNLNVDNSERVDIHGALIDADLTFRCYQKLRENYLKEFDFIDLIRNANGGNISSLKIDDKDRVPESISSQLIDLSLTKPAIQNNKKLGHF